MDAGSLGHHALRARATLVLLATAAAVVLVQVGFAASDAESAASGQGGQRRVDCDTGQSLATALSGIQPGTRIRVSGTCEETVSIATGGVTIDGQGEAVLDAGGHGVALTLEGARDVTVTGLTVRNGMRGIDVLDGAVLTLVDSVVEASGSHGIEVTHAQITVERLTARENGRAGMIVNRNALVTATDSSFEGNLTGLVTYNNASARLNGTNTMSGNATQGLTAGLGAAVFSLGSDVLVNDNGEEGVLLLQGGSLQLAGGGLEVTGNGADGVRVEQMATLASGVPGFGAPGTALVADNAGHGINVRNGSDLTVSQVMPLSSEGNADAGLRADADSTIEVSASTIEGNAAADVDLSFGVAATLEGNTIGTISCDETVLSRGTTTCP